MVYAYYRYSTGKQTDMQQKYRVEEYCKTRNIRIDSVYIDRAVSGSVSIENRNLANLISKMKKGDTLVVSEVSRISRSMSDFCEFLLKGMPNMGVKLIVCNLGMEIDCDNINSTTQLLLMIFSWVAQIDLEFIKDRTQAALDARQELVRNGQGWTSKKGNWCTKLGSPQGFKNASDAAKKGAFNKKKNFMRGMRPVAEHIRLLKSTTKLDDWGIAVALNKAGFRTGNGGKFYNSHIAKVLKYDEEGIYYEDQVL